MRCPAGWSVVDLAAPSSPVSPPQAGPRHRHVPTPRGGGCGAGGRDPALVARSRTGTSPTRERAERCGRETCRDAPSEAAASPRCCSRRRGFAPVSLVQDAARSSESHAAGPSGGGWRDARGRGRGGTVQSEGPALAPGGLSPALRSPRRGTARGRREGDDVPRLPGEGNGQPRSLPLPQKRPLRVYSPRSPPPPGSPAPLDHPPPVPR